MHSRRPSIIPPFLTRRLRMTSRHSSLVLALLLSPVVARAADEPVDLGTVTEKHEMIPMRDDKKLSTYLYFPEGKGPWPVLYEQRYADIRSATSRKAFA